MKKLPPGTGTVRMLSKEEWDAIQDIKPRTPYESKFVRSNARLRTSDPVHMVRFWIGFSSLVIWFIQLFFLSFFNSLIINALAISHLLWRGHKSVPPHTPLLCFRFPSLLDSKHLWENVALRDWLCMLCNQCNLNVNVLYMNTIYYTWV